MYEQISHTLLNKILEQLKPDLEKQDLRHFYTRLGANFYAIYSLFHLLYGERDDFEEQMVRLVNVMARKYWKRPESLKAQDKAREADHNWFLSQEWVGMALYTDGFSGSLKGLREHLGYLQELGINLVHVMPILKCPQGSSDGGYAVSDYREVDPRIGSNEDLEELAENLRLRDMLLVLDVVVNHTSDEHPWAQQARAGDRLFQSYYYTFPDRNIPDLFEETLPEIFPETSPGNFTWDPQMQRWVMTVFNEYQWDLNYGNPAVFIEMLEIILYWANRGADIVRLDAVAFLWKKVGTISQNEREAHLILQLFKDCCQVTAPGVLFIAEAIVAPGEIAKYFGEDAVIAKECEIAYNATLMALLWDAVATKNTRVLTRGINSLPVKLDRATWLNYVRCHDDIGLGFDDADIAAAGYAPHAHRQFLLNYYTGDFAESAARGRAFGRNDKTGDARISGTLASLVGLETAVESEDPRAIDLCIHQILLLHGVILSFGGLPLLYYGDEIGTFNDFWYLDDPDRASDNRWMHRPRIDWARADRRHEAGTLEQRIFDGLKRMIAVRKVTPAFADFNNRELIETDNEHLFAFRRQHPTLTQDAVIVIANFDVHPQKVKLANLGLRAQHAMEQVRDLVSGEAPQWFGDQMVVAPFGFYWLRQAPR